MDRTIKLIALVGIVMLLVGTTLAGATALRLTEREPPLPQGVPGNLPSSFFNATGGSLLVGNETTPVKLESLKLIADGQLQVASDPSFFFVPTDFNKTLTIYFPQQQTVLGDIAVLNDTFTIHLPYNATANGTTGGEQVFFADHAYAPQDVPQKQVDPSMTVPLVVKPQYDHEWILATARAHLNFYTVIPGARGSGIVTLQKRDQPIERQIAFFVVTPDEYLALQQRYDWAYVALGPGLPQAPRSEVILIYLFGSCAGIVGGALVLGYVMRHK